MEDKQSMLNLYESRAIYLRLRPSSSAAAAIVNIIRTWDRPILICYAGMHNCWHRFGIQNSSIKKRISINILIGITFNRDGIGVPLRRVQKIAC